MVIYNFINYLLQIQFISIFIVDYFLQNPVDFYFEQILFWF